MGNESDLILERIIGETINTPTQSAAAAVFDVAEINNAMGDLMDNYLENILYQ